MFQTSHGSAPRTKSPIASGSQRRQRGCFQIVQAMTGTAIGTICDVSQNASPATSPKSADAERIGPFDDPEREQDQQRAVDEVHRVEARLVLELEEHEPRPDPHQHHGRERPAPPEQA